MTRIRILLISLVACSPLMLLGQQPKLEVLANSPTGSLTSIDQSLTIFVCFNQPMVPLKEEPQDEETGPLLLVPKIHGKFRWLGTKMLTFIPSDTLPLATRIVATVPRGTKSLSGAPLEHDFSWTFETPRPVIVRFNPDTAETNSRFFRYGLSGYEQGILLKFNIAVDPGALPDFVRLEEISNGSAAAQSFIVRHPTKGELRSSWIWEPFDHSIVIVPSQPLKSFQQYRIRCIAGLPAKQGRLGMKSDFEYSFITPRKFMLTRIELRGEQWGGNEVAMKFSNPLGTAISKMLSFNPAVAENKLTYAETGDSALLVYGGFEPEQEYTLTVRRGIKDIFGDTLPEDVHYTFKTRPTPTSASFGGPHLIQAESALTVPLTFVNADRARIDVNQIDPALVVPIIHDLEYAAISYSPWPGFHWSDQSKISPRQWRRIYSKEWEINALHNMPLTRTLVLNDTLRAARRGIFLISADLVKQVGRERRYYHHLVQFTDLGITLKFSADTNLIWVNKLSGGSPVADASVEIRSDSNVVVWSGRTDLRGLALAPGWRRLGLRSAHTWEDRPNQWVLVTKGDDAAFASLDWTYDIQREKFGLKAPDERREDQFRAVVFTDRNLYRPGEHVHIKGVVRRMANNQLIVPKGLKLRFLVTDSKRNRVFQVEPTASSYGSFSVSFPLDSEASLGHYSMALNRMKQDDEPPGYFNQPWESIAEGKFDVEMFKPSDVEVKSTTGLKQYVAGDSLTGSISARYLFGAPYRNAPVSWKVFLNPVKWKPPGFPDYFFGLLPWESGRRGNWRRPDFERRDTLNAEGRRDVVYRIPTGVIAEAQSLRLEASVFTKDYRSVAGSTTAIVHNGEFSLGIAPSTMFCSEGDVIGCRFVSITQDQKMVDGVSFTARAVRKFWRSFEEKDSTGKSVVRWRLLDTVTATAQLKTSERPVRWQIRAGQAGFYVFEAEAYDSRGNRILSQASCYVSGSGTSSWQRYESNRVGLIVEKSIYEPGDTARIIVPSPYPASQAMVTIEREGILRQFTMELKGHSSQLSLPVLREYAPNVFVSVVLIPSRAQGGKKQQGFVMGYTNLIVSPKDKQLSVVVHTDKPGYHPGDTVEIHLSVKNARGSGVRCEVALSIPDRAILNLTGYRFPSLLDAFYTLRPLVIETADSRLQYEVRPYTRRFDRIANYASMAVAVGDDETEPRAEFRALAYWSPEVLTDASGNASVKFKLPDDLTEFQVMASAQTADSEFGYGECSFTVSLPLLLQPTLPRFVRAGDEFKGGVVVHNYSALRKEVQLAVNVNGLVVEGTSTAVCSLAPGESKVVHFPFRAAKPGRATVTFAATEGPRRLDGVQSSIPVEPGTRRQTIAIYESTADQKTIEHVVVPTAAVPDAGEIEAFVSCSGMVGLSDALTYVLTYPYGCLEQKLSAVLPLITAGELVRAFKPTGLNVSNVDSVVGTTLARLKDHLLSTGGYSYWPSGQEANHYLSALAVYTLVQAKRANYVVDKSQIDLGFRFLRSVLDGKEAPRYYTQGALWCTRALILYTFSLEGRPDEQEMTNLFSIRFRLPVFARAYLLKSFLLSKNHESEISELAADLSGLAKVSSLTAHFEESDESGFAWIFHSNVRTTALALQALIETQPENPLIPKIIRWLLEKRQYGRWRTTQENLYTIDALASYFHKFESGKSNLRAVVRIDSLTLVDRQFDRKELAVASGSCPLSQLRQGTDYPVQIEKQGDGTLYYGLRMNYYPSGKMIGSDEGLTVLKKISTVDTTPTTTGSYLIGTLLKVQLTIVTNVARSFVAVDDPLPAGFEAINDNFMTTPIWDRSEDSESQAQRWWRQYPFDYAELRDDRVVLFADDLPPGIHTFTYFVRASSRGSFTMPSTHAECMYEPEISGQSASKTVRIE